MTKPPLKKSFPGSGLAKDAVKTKRLEEAQLRAQKQARLVAASMLKAKRMRGAIVEEPPISDAERIKHLEGEVRAILYSGANTIAMLLRSMIPTVQGHADTARKLRLLSDQATEQGQSHRADMLWMASEMVELDG